MGYDKSAMLWLELALTPELLPRHLPSLLERFGDVESVFEAGLLELGACGLDGGAARGLEARAGRRAAEEEAAPSCCGIFPTRRRCCSSAANCPNRSV